MTTSSDFLHTIGFSHVVIGMGNMGNAVINDGYQVQWRDRWAEDILHSAEEWSNVGRNDPIDMFRVDDPLRIVYVTDHDTTVVASVPVYPTGWRTFAPA